MDQQSVRRSASKKKVKPPPVKGKKSDESERVATGAGWTAAATQKFFDCVNDDERLQHVMAMFTITDQQYKYDNKSTILIDFHFSNGLFCIDQKYDLIQTQFVCRTLDKLLQSGIHMYTASDVTTAAKQNIDSIRAELMNQFQAAFNELNSTEWHFTPETLQALLNYLTAAFFRPLRMVLHPFTFQRKTELIPFDKKVFQPITPIPLSECEEERPPISEEMEFHPMNLMKKEGITLEDAKDMIRKYTDDVILKINQRYDLLEEMMTKLHPLVSADR